MSNRFTRLFNEPLIQFLVIGACIYGAYGLFAPPAESDMDSTVVVDANRINGFVAQWASRWNRPPTREELDSIINEYIREEILYRQAVAMGLDEDDAVTRRRMAQRLEFLTSDLARVSEPDEAELERYLRSNMEQFRAPATISFAQVYFDPDTRGDKTLIDAADVLEELRSKGTPDTGAVDAGDHLSLPGFFDSATELEVRKRMGGGFSDSVFALTPGSWHGPVLSGFGVHLVYVFERMQAQDPVLADFAPQVFDAWQREQVESFNLKFYQGLKERYTVIVEDDQLPPESVLKVSELATPSDGVGQ